MGELIPIGQTLKHPDDSDILTDIYIGLNLAAEDLGYQEDRLGWLRRLETVLAADVHADYVEFTGELWDK